eukprot:gnl/TRDRNA2_/TRDRNA2_189237_c0_seq1.p1 gnl/TRDRNA2_/TRDRNA2_189237_c0~~gnl/TRDRNA2_/TRDRNA2_189237_c0_seq1.p1  ORF type:complete len:702 (+),score=95.76 gnl/TRDRNA2_/TRDRNA2_189237_c0_seq1:275-2107(+)
MEAHSSRRACATAARAHSHAGHDLEGSVGRQPAHGAKASASCCLRCFDVVGGEGHAPALSCAECRESVHAKCMHPALSDAACDAVRTAGPWLCEGCQQERILAGAAVTRNYSFCVACMGREDARNVVSDLMQCTSCRASYHPGCVGLRRAPRASSRWTCPQCDGSSVSGRIELFDWSLFLLRQLSGRMIPVVRGRRSDVAGPPRALWSTSEIIHAVTPTMLITRTRMVIHLKGPLSRDLAVKFRLPSKLIQQFSAGFPVQAWMPLIRYSDRAPPPDVEAALCAVGGDKRAACTGAAPSKTSDPRRSDSSALAAGATQKPTRTTRRRGEGAEGGKRQCEDKDALPAQKRRRGATESGRPQPCPVPAPAAAGRGAGKKKAMDAVDSQSKPVSRRHGQSSKAKMRELLEAQSFDRSGLGRDLLAVPVRTPTKDRQSAHDSSSPTETSGTAAVTGTAGCPPTTSPASLKFLNSLHTGLTPKNPRAPALRQLVFDESVAGSPGANEDLFDFGGRAWQPVGLDGFICEARARRRKLGKNRCLRGAGSPPPRAADLAARQRCGDTRKMASDLLRKDEEARAAQRLEDATGTPKSVPSDCEDEAAPVADISFALAGAE